MFTFSDQPWLGKLSKLRVWHDNEGSSPDWNLASIYILDELSGRLFCFVFDSWLSKEAGAVLREIPVGAMALYKEAGMIGFCFTLFFVTSQTTMWSPLL